MVAPGVVLRAPEPATAYRIDLVEAVWWRIAATLDALHMVMRTAPWSVGRATSAEIAQQLAAAGVAGNEEIANRDLALALHILAMQDNMIAGDWLRSRAVDASMPRRKPPPALDLQLRLKGVNCTRLVATLVRGEDNEPDGYRVTIRNVRGDVSSVVSESFANALEGALGMAGAKEIKL